MVRMKHPRIVPLPPLAKCVPSLPPAHSGRLLAQHTITSTHGRLGSRCRMPTPLDFILDVGGGPSRCACHDERGERSGWCWRPCAACNGLQQAVCVWPSRRETRSPTVDGDVARCACVPPDLSPVKWSRQLRRPRRGGLARADPYAPVARTGNHCLALLAFPGAIRPDNVGLRAFDFFRYPVPPASRGRALCSMWAISRPLCRMLAGGRSLGRQITSARPPLAPSRPSRRGPEVAAALKRRAKKTELPGDDGTPKDQASLRLSKRSTGRSSRAAHQGTIHASICYIQPATAALSCRSPRGGAAGWHAEESNADARRFASPFRCALACRAAGPAPEDPERRGRQH